MIAEAILKRGYQIRWSCYAKPNLSSYSRDPKFNEEIGLPQFTRWLRVG